MLKKLMISIFALVLGGAVAEARELVSLGIYFNSECSVDLEGELPAGVTRGPRVR